MRTADTNSLQARQHFAPSEALRPHPSMADRAAFPREATPPRQTQTTPGALLPGRWLIPPEACTTSLSGGLLWDIPFSDNQYHQWLVRELAAVEDSEERARPQRFRYCAVRHLYYCCCINPYCSLRLRLRSTPPTLPLRRTEPGFAEICLSPATLGNYTEGVIQFAPIGVVYTLAVTHRRFYLLLRNVLDHEHLEHWSWEDDDSKMSSICGEDEPPSPRE